MNNEPTLFEKIRRIEDELIRQKKQQGIEIKYDIAHGLNKGEKSAYFKHEGKWIHANSIIKFSMAMNLSKEHFNKFLTGVNKD